MGSRLCQPRILKQLLRRLALFRQPLDHIFHELNKTPLSLFQRVAIPDSNKTVGMGASSYSIQAPSILTSAFGL